MDSTTKRVQTAYDTIAPVFASYTLGDRPENLVRLGRCLLEHCGHTPTILEVGCGTGHFMAWFETEGAAVTGIDLSAGMLAYARRATAGPLLMMDMRHLAFRPASFDGAWCCASLLHLPKSDAPQALRAIRRVLKPGGMLMLSIQEGDFEGWNGGYVEGVMRFFARYSIDEMKTLLTESHFSVARVEKDQARTRTWLAFVCVAR